MADPNVSRGDMFRRHVGKEVAGNGTAPGEGRIPNTVRPPKARGPDVGTTVRVLSGPLSGTQGKVAGIRPDGRMEIHALILGQTVYLDINWREVGLA